MSAWHRFAVSLILGLGLMIQLGAALGGDGIRSVNVSLLGLSLVILASLEMILARLKP
jgi:hypothetical protein